MTLQELAEEFQGPRSPGWLVLGDAEVLACAVEALRFCAAHLSIASLTRHDAELPGVGPTGSPPVVQIDGLDMLIAPLPVRDLGLLGPDVVLTVGEWSIIRPLFALYVERENALRLEASRAMGLEVYGRQASEVAQDISIMERETIPRASFCHVIITI